MTFEDELKEAGYRRHPAEKVKEYCDFFYQKRILDDSGTRYFVQFWHYPPIDEVRPDGSWLFEIHLNEPHSTMEVHRPEQGIEWCEERAEAFWSMMGGIYYEKNE